MVSAVVIESKSLLSSLLSPFLQSSLIRQIFYFFFLMAVFLTALYTEFQYLSDVSSQREISAVRADAKVQLRQDQISQAIEQKNLQELESLAESLFIEEPSYYIQIQSLDLPDILVGYKSESNKSFHVLKRPLSRSVGEKSKIVGNIEIGLDDRGVKSLALSKVFSHLIFNFTAIVLLLLFLGVFFHRKITKPLLELTQEARVYKQNLLPYLELNDRQVNPQEILKDQIGDIHQLQQAMHGLKMSFEKAVKLQNQFELEKTKAEIELAREKERREYYQRMELLGRLTAQVTHDFNNIIFLATLKTESLERKLQPELQVVTRQIRSILHQSNEIIDLLLSYVKQKPKEKQAYNISTLILEMVPLFEVALGRRYNLLVEGLDIPALVFLEKVAFSSAILNVLVNARDAQLDGGDIRVVISQISEVEVEVRVIDQGDGIPIEFHEKIFEPLFTTKHGTMGTGLGLPQVKDAIESFGGRVLFISKPKVGTEFSLILPIFRPTS